MNNKQKVQFYLAAVILFIAFLTTISSAQTTGFNFQGRLNDGSNPANGRYDLQFLLYDALVGGNQVGAIVSKPNTVLINGVFSTQLDFGSAAFSGGNRFLEIQVRPAGSPNAHVILGARQQIASVPYAVKSLNATNADNATNAQNAVNATNATNAQNALSLGGVAASNYLLKNGDGSQLTNVTAVNSQQLGGVAASRYLASDANGNANVGGNLTQPLANNGLPKAIVRLDRDGNIASCYNGVTNASTGNCGFGTNHPQLGVYGINFGFNVSNRVIFVSSEWDADDTLADIFSRSTNAITINVLYPQNQDPTNAPINIIVY